MKRRRSHTDVSSDETADPGTLPSSNSASASSHRWVFEPFVVQDGLGDSSAASPLCHVCRTIDFRRALTLAPSDISLEGHPVFTLDRLHVTEHRASCLACKMFASMAWDELEESGDNAIGSIPDTWHLRVFRITSLWGIPTEKRLLSEEITAFISLVLSHASRTLKLAKRREAWSRGIILPTAEKDKGYPSTALKCHGFKASSFAQGYRIRDMVERCLNDHRCAPVLEEFPQKAHVIDCEVRSIVPLLDDMEYFALSYVWGQGPALDNDARLKHMSPVDEYPVAIQDAMSVVKMCGYRYLWVDRYCIQQHNNADKQHQISQMANIYSNAVATICSLGLNAESGMDGISISRKVQQSFEVQNTVLIRCPWPELELQKYIETSTWAKRGWTFQEALCSTRCLFFTAEQVIHVCRKDTAAETLQIPGAPPGRHSLKLSADIFERDFDWATKRPPAFLDGFTRAVQHFQGRSFTYEQDSLNGFKGILSILPMRSYWGVPILNMGNGPSVSASDMDQGFAFGLLWHVIKSPRQLDSRRIKLRQQFFPSWSWICQAGMRIEFVHYSSSGYRQPLNKCFLGGASSFRKNHVKFSGNICGEYSDGTAFRLGSLFSDLRNWNIAPEQTAFLIVTSVTATWDFTDGTLQGPETSYHMLKDPSPVSLYHISDPAMTVNDAMISLDCWLGQANEPETQSGVGNSTSPGLAVLIMVSNYFVGPPVAYWLAVRPSGDGRFQRQGLIACQTDEVQGEISPRPESYRTIRIG